MSKEEAIATYRLILHGLSKAVSRCTPGAKHQTLIRTLQMFEPLASIGLAAQRGNRHSATCKVLNAQGQIVDDNHEAWLRGQLAADDGCANTTYERLKDAGYLLSRCNITTLYLVNDRHGVDESNFLQVEVDIEDEVVDRALFADWSPEAPSGLRDLMNMPGYEISDGDRRRVRAPAYRMRSCVDVRAFVNEARILEAKKRSAFRQRQFRIQTDGRPDHILLANEAFPDWDAQPVKWGRMFDDWAVSSSGRSGARLCNHWVMQTSDYTDPDGNREMGLVPLWTSTLKLAEIDGRKGSAYELFGKLEKLDRRVGVPFAWYFYMLHGNRVNDTAGHRVIEAAEAGKIVLPEHDYRVLKSWALHPYGF